MIFQNVSALLVLLLPSTHPLSPQSSPLVYSGTPSSLPLAPLLTPSQLLLLPRLPDTSYRLLHLPPHSPPRKPHLHCLRRCHHHRPDHRRWRRIQRSSPQLARRQTQRNPHHHRRKNARAPPRPRQRRRSRPDPRSYRPLCQETCPDEPRHQEHHDRHHRFRRRRRPMATDHAPLHARLLRGPKSRRCRHVTVCPARWRQDDHLGSLAAFRLCMRNIDLASSTYIDGGTSCLAGRTAAYRTVILKDPEFLYGFTHDYWLGKYQLNSGDDLFLTRWMVSHGWKTYVQVCKEAEILSTMKPNWRFLKQVSRWTRNNWRSDLRSVFVERHVWTSYQYVAYTMVCFLFRSFLKWVLILWSLNRWTNCSIRWCCSSGSVSFRILFTKARESCRADGVLLVPSSLSLLIGFLLSRNMLGSYIVWLLATRTAKLLPYLWYRPQDVIYVPAHILFGYYYAIMKLYALFTLHKVRHLFPVG